MGRGSTVQDRQHFSQSRCISGKLLKCGRGLGVVVNKSLKAGFHWRQSQSQYWSRKSASDLVKVKNRSRRRSHKLDGIRLL